MKKNKFSLSAFLDDPRGRAALALLIAVFTWTLVTTVINPGTTRPTAVFRWITATEPAITPARGWTL